MIEVRVREGVEGAAALTQIKLAAMRFPGAHRLRVVAVADRIDVDPACGPRARSIRATLTLGDEWTYDGSPACVAALSDFGEVVVSDD